MSLGVSSPAIVLIEDQGNEYVVTANDPQMLPGLKQINISFNKRKVTIELPQGELCGKPVSVKIKK